MDDNYEYESWVEHPTMLCEYDLEDVLNDIVGFLDYPEEYDCCLDQMLLEASNHFGYTEDDILGKAYRKLLKLGNLEIEAYEEDEE